MPYTDIILVGGINLATGRIVDAVINGIRYLINSFNDYIYLYIIFDPKLHPKNAYAVARELESHSVVNTRMLVGDGGVTPNYKLPNGTYRIPISTPIPTPTPTQTSIKKIWITLEDDKVTLCTRKRLTDIYLIDMVFNMVKFFTQLVVNLPSALKTRDEILKNKAQDNLNKLITDFRLYYDGIYSKYNATTQVLISFTSEGSKWNFPIFRRPRANREDKWGDHIKILMADVDEFMTKEQQYEDEGHPYRKGYLLYGRPGSGKSASIELIAIKYNMSIYMINLNAEKMTDAVLTNLISSVPMRSILVFEEIDKQIDTLKNNANQTVSIGSILSATDGPQRLSHGTIIIMTANNNTFLEGEEKEAAFREGRIDKTYHFDAPFYKL